MKRLLFILFAGLLMWSCSKEDAGTADKGTDIAVDHFVAHETANYMEFFFIPRSLKLEYLEPTFTQGAIAMKLPIFDNDDNKPSKFYCFFPSYPDSIKLPYYNYTKYYGDTTYWQHHTMAHNGLGCIMPLKSILIVADRDLDELHPAGTPINDLFDIGYSRIYSYIQNGYNPKGANDNAIYSISPLSSFNGAYLFPEESRLLFKKSPSVHGKYTFTVTLTFDKDPVSGESLELAPASIEIEF